MFKVFASLLCFFVLHNAGAQTAVPSFAFSLQAPSSHQQADKSAIPSTIVNRPIIQLRIQGVIGPATEDYFLRSMQKAYAEQALAVVLVMDTPGGLDTSMRGIIKSIMTSAVPVVTYVAPSGSRAASAGTYILYASHIAAMAPGTNLGAATPVKIGGMPSAPPTQPQQPAKPGADKPVPKTTQPPPPADKSASDIHKKALNDAVAYIRSLAQLRGRNEQWAEKAVREAASLPAEEALKENVIDLLAVDMADLLKQIHGRKINIAQQVIELQTQQAELKLIEPDWRSQLLSVITNPNVAYMLMLIGIYGLIFEFTNPGAILPGTVGAICLLLAMYALQLLPVNYAGLALLLLGVALMVAEAFQPSFGVLGVGGIIAFVIGSIILMDTDVPGFGIDPWVIAAFALMSLLMFVLIVGMAVRSRKAPVVSGMEELVGAQAEVMDDFDRHGWVYLHSEKWKAHTSTPVHRGQTVKVTALKGLELEVEPLSSTQKE